MQSSLCSGDMSAAGSDLVPTGSQNGETLVLAIANMAVKARIGLC